jgi:murein L,D-transpeptidase YcbB/YkuD
MIGIIFLWLAFTPVQPVLPGIHASRTEHLQRKTQSPARPRKSIVRNPLADKIHRYFNRQLPEKGVAGAPDKVLLKNRLKRFYAAREYQPVWTKRPMVAELVSSIERVTDDGLDPADYHIKEIRAFFVTPPSTPDLEVHYDLLLSDAFLTLANHLRYGKVDPVLLDPNWNITDVHKRTALELRLQQALVAERVASVLEELRPQHPGYNELKKELARYRNIAKEGGWSVLPNGVELKEGVTDSRIPEFRKRLQATGELSLTSADTSQVYSKEMVEAVKHFQKRNGVYIDGVLGASTLKNMNIPVERRIEQICINLERCRWFLNDLEPTCVVVNIAEFSLHYYEHGHKRWDTRVIVGQPYRKTPVFKADMQYIIFNPRWVVPPTILAKDVLPAIKKNRSYLNKKKLKVIDRDGQEVNPVTLDWSHFTAGNFPYRLQQTSGDHGSLGRIKFLLPNRYTVYLHDTPTKDLFAKTTRTFSSGCIRVENPQELARLVLLDSVKWSRSKISAAINTGKTTSVTLPKRVPVFILYLTAFAEGDDIVYHEDVYNRDNEVLQALLKPLY